ncbi:fimbria/pilus outer membrane usher protein [Escherichia coli]|nr:fimbria/pilus outer membrane usher protein [Escherichia coli]
MEESQQLFAAGGDSILKGELTVGDDYTAGDFFDSVSFRGVQLASDDNMRQTA